jgi:hypothetical protein
MAFVLAALSKIALTDGVHPSWISLHSVVKFYRDVTSDLELPLELSWISSQSSTSIWKETVGNRGAIERTKRQIVTSGGG